MSSPWTDEMIERLRGLNTSRDCSRTDIARILAAEFPTAVGMTRNAVLGKLHRLGLNGVRPKKEARHAPRAKRRRPPAPRPAVQAAPREPRFASFPDVDIAALRRGCFENPDGRGVRLIDIRDGQCRWPLGDSRDYETFRFCGEPTQTRIVWVTKTKPVETSASFCCEHYALSTSRDPAHRALMRASSPSVRRCDASVVEAPK